MPSSYPIRSKASFDLSNALFVGSLLCMGLAEAFIIRGLWFRSTPSFHRVHGFDLPFLVWIPAVGALLLMREIRKLCRNGEISAALASSLSSGLGILLLMAYLLLSRLAQIAFR